MATRVLVVLDGEYRFGDGAVPVHEGQTLGAVAGQTYMQNSPFGDTTKPEFREVAGHRQLPH